MAQKHICGLCGKEFASEERYLDHTCEVTGAAPLTPVHVEITEKIRRGEILTEE